MNHKLHFLLLFCLLAAASSCDSFERNINIDLPEVERQLVIECYLRPGEPYRLLLTETKGYFDPLDECPMVQGAVAVIEHAGRRDTLTEALYLGECTLTNPNFVPYFDDSRTRFYNYGSSEICPLDYNSDFTISVYDATGNRTATATTRMIPPVPITSFVTIWNADTSKAYAFIRAQDDGNTVDFYRIQLHKRRLYRPDSLTNGFFNVAKNPDFDVTIDDARFFNGEEIAFGTNYDYEREDTLIATIYHLEQAYHDYLEGIDESESANGNPFAQPPTIKSNVSGGTGIFTFLSFDRDTIVAMP
jgi:hypothetical protein